MKNKLHFFGLMALLAIIGFSIIACGDGAGGGGGDGSAGNPFLVNSVAALRKVGTGEDGWTMSAHYKQTADIDLANVENWTAIGYFTDDDDNALFTGTYDGGGFTISNLTINATTICQGLLGLIDEDGVVKNVGIVNCDITSTSSFVGGVVGLSMGTVLNCYASGTVSGDGSVGGVVGGSGGTVLNCYATGTVSGDRDVGGVVGYNDGGTVSNCYATSTVSGRRWVAGVVGDNSSSGGGTVMNCVALNNSITRTDGTETYFGRVIGNMSGTPTNYARDNMLFIDEYGNSSTTFPTSTRTVNGTDIASTQWSDSTWWTSTALWSDTIWDFSGISETSYPKLR